MTLLHMQILLYYFDGDMKDRMLSYVSEKASKELKTMGYIEFLNPNDIEFLNSNAMEYEITPKGEAYCWALLEVPEPVQIWSVPE